MADEPTQPAAVPPDSAVDPAPPLLLRGDLHTSALGVESGDFQVRIGRPELAADAGATPCVVVLTRTADREVDELSVALAAAGIPLLRLDSDRPPDHELCWDPARGVVEADGVALRPLVAWSRYFTAASVPATGRDPVSAAYLREGWRGAAAALAAVGAPAARVNPTAGPDRLEQLACARAAGLRTPATLVTNALAAAARRLPGDGDVIVKSVGEHYVEPEPGDLTGLTPRRATRAELAAERTREPAPALVQEFLSSSAELRVYAVAGRLVAFEVVKASVEALWRDPSGLAIRPVETPTELVAPLTGLLARWALDVAAFDLLVTPEGPVFLEVNPACDWLWCERPTGGTAVSEAVRELVIGMFERRRRERAREGDAR